MTIRPATKEEIDAIFETACDTVYSDAELFDFTKDDKCVSVESGGISYDIPVELAEFIKDFNKYDYNYAIMLFVCGETVEGVMTYFED